MEGLREIIESLDASAAVRGAAIVGEDGLVIHDALEPGADGEALAALAVTTLQHAQQLGATFDSGELRTAVFEFGSGPAILTALSPTAALVVLARPGRDLGALLYALRTRRDSLTRLL